MHAQRETFQKAVAQVLEAVMFENWLRFYFITRKDGDATEQDDEGRLFVAVPDRGMERIRKDYAHLLPMAEAVNGRKADFETSRRAVCAFVLERLDGKTMPRDMVGIVLESATFQAQLQLFNAWVRAHEDRLDEGFLDFAAWRSLFAKWRQNPEVRDLAEKLLVSGGMGGRAESAPQ
ncbi:MAG: hypothetical protein LBB66_02520 [Desulfovibrio sp.]|jgi:hypothetical protein|nr:hypothetical protein [Desulfovibrio sp.]